MLYKISDRDTSKYDNYTLDTVVTFEQAIKMYRCITGACEGGTKHFVENVLQLKQTLTEIKEIANLSIAHWDIDYLKQAINEILQKISEVEDEK